MPIYTFKCPGCGKAFESYIPVDEYIKGPKPKCPWCDVKLERAYLAKDTPTFEMTGVGLKRPGKEKK